MTPTSQPDGITFTRALAAFQRNLAGNIELAGVNVLRASHYRGGVRTICLEPARTNVALRSSEFGTAPWSSVGTPITVADVAAGPNGVVEADSIQDDDPAGSEGRRQDVTIVTSAEVWCVSLFIKKTAVGTSPNYPVLNHRLTGGTTIDNYTAVDPQLGTFNSTLLAGVATGGVEDYATGYYRFFNKQANNNSVGNVTLRITVFPANATTLAGGIATSVVPQGTQTFWHLQAEIGAFPTSPIPTGAAAVARPVDVFTIPAPSLPKSAQICTLFSRYYDPAAAAWTNEAVDYVPGTPIVPSVGANGREYSHIAVLKGRYSAAGGAALVKAEG